MILPIYTYGEPVLRKISEDIDVTSAETQTLINDMFETMYHANGVGLAGPQIGKAIRIFVIDTEPFLESFPDAQVKRELSSTLLSRKNGATTSYFQKVV